MLRMGLDLKYPQITYGVVVLVIVFACATAAAANKTATPAKVEAEAKTPKPKPIERPSAEAIDKSIRCGVDFLLERQIRNGAWGSARRTKGLNVYAPVPGAHHAFRAAVTSLCLSALIESSDSRKEVAAAIDLGQKWLFSHLKAVRRAEPRAIYNNWAHAYSIQALIDLYDYHSADRLGKGPGKGDTLLLEDTKEHIRRQIDMLGRYECIDGGWTYYDNVAFTQRPSGSSMCFVSATVLVALKEAQRIDGVEVPKRLVERAKASIVRQRRPGFAYCYGEYLKNRPMVYVNRPGGSLGRSQACNLAMYVWGDKKTTLDVMRIWLDRLYARNMWLDIARKRPIPHESWMKVAGYFYYYGHFYAACCIDQLPLAERPYFQGHLAHILLPLQEKDGSWWDFPLYDYHQQYGTAMAVMSLVRCRAAGAAGKK
ncbi:MAG: hypothetical protein U9N87_09145 [Planctomycetota bacterium]|nr:hypothetical protein [Planctomycetota bacterium]